MLCFRPWNYNLDHPALQIVYHAVASWKEEGANVYDPGRVPLDCGVSYCFSGRVSATLVDGCSPALPALLIDTRKHSLTFFSCRLWID